MYVGRLIITKQSPSEDDAVSDAINALLGSLRMNGQICGREFPIAVTTAGYVVTVLLPEKTSLDALHRNLYVRMSLQKLQVAGLEASGLEFNEDLDGEDVCACKHPTSYILYTTYVSLESPLRCGDCFSPVPLYRIPPTKDEEYNNVLVWESYYQACDTLQMNCTPIERTAMRQLTHLESGLSQDGLAICHQIKELTQIQVYYYLYRYKGRSLQQEKKRLCPSCQREWLLPEKWHRFDFRCDHCGLVSNIAYRIG